MVANLLGSLCLHLTVRVPSPAATVQPLPVQNAENPARHQYKDGSGRWGLRDPKCIQYGATWCSTAQHGAHNSTQCRRLNHAWLIKNANNMAKRVYLRGINTKRCTSAKGRNRAQCSATQRNAAQRNAAQRNASKMRAQASANI